VGAFGVPPTDSRTHTCQTDPVVIEPLGISGAYRVTPVAHKDERGEFYEWYRPDLLAEATGADWCVQQANVSQSRQGALRGIHFADIPPGQAKYVTCVQGRVADVVVDVRVGSPTFGRWIPVELDARSKSAVLISEGLGHGFQALTPDATVMYLLSQRYNPGIEHAVNPLCPTLAIRWPVPNPLLSPKDRQAPSLPEAAAQGLLPKYLG
jgi:dTDP-4-dehydrorhamnose 3,5-epimerase